MLALRNGSPPAKTSGQSSRRATEPSSSSVSGLVPASIKGVALNQLKERLFAVFTVRVVDRNDIDFICEPLSLADFGKEIPNAYVLPWYNKGRITAIRIAQVAIRTFCSSTTPIPTN